MQASQRRKSFAGYAGIVGVNPDTRKLLRAMPRRSSSTSEIIGEKILIPVLESGPILIAPGSTEGAI
jgi:hypothetical protein